MTKIIDFFETIIAGSFPALCWALASYDVLPGLSDFPSRSSCRPGPWFLQPPTDPPPSPLTSARQISALSPPTLGGFKTGLVPGFFGVGRGPRHWWQSEYRLQRSRQERRVRQIIPRQRSPGFLDKWHFPNANRCLGTLAMRSWRVLL